MFTFLQSVYVLSGQHIKDPIPFFELPKLVQEEIMSNLSPIDLFLLSTVSRKTKELIKNHRNWKKLKILMVFHSEFFSFSFCEPEYPINRLLIAPYPTFSTLFLNDAVTIGDQVVKFQRERENVNLRTFWKYQMDGILKVGNILLDMFQNPDVSFYFVRKPMISSEPVVNWLMNRNVRKLTHLTMEGSKNGVEDAHNILEHFQITKKFCVDLPIDCNKMRHRLPRNLTYLSAYNSQNLKLDHFSIINPEISYLSESGFTSEDLNRFLKAWMNGEVNSRLKYFQCRPILEIDRRRVLEGVEGVEQPRELKRSYRLSELTVVNFAGGFDVRRRHDGVLATIAWSQVFRMIVWTL